MSQAADHISNMYPDPRQQPMNGEQSNTREPPVYQPGMGPSPYGGQPPPYGFYQPPGQEGGQYQIPPPYGPQQLPGQQQQPVIIHVQDNSGARVVRRIICIRFAVAIVSVIIFIITAAIVGATYS